MKQSTHVRTRKRSSPIRSSRRSYERKWHRYPQAAAPSEWAVVENQKARIIRELIKAATRLGTKPEVIAVLEDAANQNQFTAAVEDIKFGIPESLLINGHNPLLLLHRALSEGIHANTDRHCLQLSQDVRIVLAELAKRIAQATKDETELQGAVNRLLMGRQAAGDLTPG